MLLARTWDLLKRERKTVAFGVVALLLLTAGYYNNSWKVAHQITFDNFQQGSESLIVGRLILDQKEGMFSKGGLLGRYYDRNISDNKFHQYELYKNNLSTRNLPFKTYDSQTAGQAMAYGLFQHMTGFTNANNLRIFWLGNSLLTALSMLLFLLWVRRNFGSATGIISLMLLIFSFWMTLFGRNLYWCLWAFYVPFLVLLLLLEREQRNGKEVGLAKLGLILFLAVWLKCFFTGFEYITTTLIMMVTPMVFYSLYHLWARRKLLSRFFTSVLSSLVAILVSFTLLAYQISFVRGSVKAGFEFIAYSYFKRTSGNPGEFPAVYRKSLQSTVPEVLGRYWNGAAFDFTTWIPHPSWHSLFIIDFGEFILILLAFSAVAFTSNHLLPSVGEKLKKNRALIATLWFSILAPLSWFIVFKAHSYIHTKMNFIAWYMPFALFGFVLIGSIGSSAVSDFVTMAVRGHKTIRRVIPIGGILLVVALAFYLSLARLPEYRMLHTLENQKDIHRDKNGFTVILYGDALWYIKDDFTESDLNNKFFLHVYPVDSVKTAKLNRFGFVNLDFYASNYRLNLPWWSAKRILFIKKPLPKSRIKFLKTGQRSAGTRLWGLTLGAPDDTTIVNSSDAR